MPSQAPSHLAGSYHYAEQFLKANLMACPLHPCLKRTIKVYRPVLLGKEVEVAMVAAAAEQALEPQISTLSPILRLLLSQRLVMDLAPTPEPVSSSKSRNLFLRLSTP
jgi:hypothetical protein